MRLAAVTGVAETVAHCRANRLYNAQEAPVEKVVGRLNLSIEPEVSLPIRELDLRGRKEGTPGHSKLLVAQLAEKNIVLNLRTLQRYLKALGFHYEKGNRRNILHDSVANIDCRNVYLEKRLANINANKLPVVPEVNERGRKPMLVIFGAFVVFRQDNKLEARLVRKSALIWPVKGKQRRVRPVRGRETADNELWRAVPNFVRKSGVAPDFHDNHGNFTADLFEQLFKNLCKTLAADYGGRHIHMDGAKYHVRKVDPQPKIDDTLAKHSRMA